MKSRFITRPLAALQFAMLLLKGASCVAGYDLSWCVVLWPLWVLLFVSVVFWGLYAAIYSKIG
jgi:hypothetical protein